MEIKIINESFLAELHKKAARNDRKRINFDLRNSPADTSQRMLNVLEAGTKVPIHRHKETAETTICIEGCLEEIFYMELPSQEEGGPIHDGEKVVDESCFREIARVTLSPKMKNYGIQIPAGAWHSIEVKEPSVIFEAKDGAYKG